MWLSLYWPWRVLFCGWGEGGSLTASLLSGKTAGFSDTSGWEGGMDKKRCRLQTSLLNGCVLFCNSLMACSRRSPAATAGLTPTFIHIENAAARVPTYIKSTKLLVALCKRLECVGILFVLHQGLLTARFIMTETYCYLCSWQPQLWMYCTQLVSLYSILGWLLLVQDTRAAVLRAKSKITEHSAALVLKGHLFHSTNSTDSKYVTNLVLYYEPMNSIFS